MIKLNIDAVLSVGIPIAVFALTTLVFVIKYYILGLTTRKVKHYIQIC